MEVSARTPAVCIRIESDPIFDAYNPGSWVTFARRFTPNATLRIGVSFRDQAGDYCRTFILRGRSGLGGLACRQAGAWRIQVAQTMSAPVAAGAFRTAGEEMPPAVLEAMDQMLAGPPLDAAGERAARDARWASR